MTDEIVGQDEFGEKVVAVISQRGGAIISIVGPRGGFGESVSLHWETAKRLAEAILERFESAPSGESKP